MDGDIDPRLRQHYGSTYATGTSEWRRVGAVGKAQNVVDLCHGVPHASVVEIGAGDGAVLQRLQDQGFAKEAYAVEISEEAAQIIRGRNIPLLVEAKAYDGGAIPYPDQRFDLAILSHVVEHLEHPRRVLYEAGRIARHVFVEVPIEDTFRRRGDFKADVTGHINFYSPKSIRWLLQTCGFQIVQERVVNQSKDVYRFGAGRKGAFDHWFKSVALRALPKLAPYLSWRYHCALLAKSPKDMGPGALHTGR